MRNGLRLLAKLSSPTKMSHQTCQQPSTSIPSSLRTDPEWNWTPDTLYSRQLTDSPPGPSQLHSTLQSPPLNHQTLNQIIQWSTLGAHNRYGQGRGKVALSHPMLCTYTTINMCNACLEHWHVALLTHVCNIGNQIPRCILPAPIK